jgi:sulfur carrier protein ThiS adenylyltransferase
MRLFSRNVPHITDILQKSVIGIAGCGGLGSNVAISLTRAGIGKLIIADFDIVEESNLNRQHYFLYDIGKPKVEALENHIKNINPNIIVESHNIKLSRDNIDKLFSEADIMIEAFDKANDKQWLIDKWNVLFPEKSIVCGNGLSGYGHFDNLKITKGGNTYYCGDNETDVCIGLCSPRVSIVANMQANLAIEILMKNAF